MVDPKNYLIYEILVRENSRMLLSYLRTLIREESDVEDLYQETMIVAWRKLEKYDQTKPFAPWLRGIASNLVMDYYREKKKSLVILNSAFIKRLNQQFEHIGSRLGSTWDEKLSAIYNCLNVLPDSYRGLIKSRYLEELPIELVADKFSVTPVNCRKRLQRARGLLANCLKKNNVLFPKGNR